jgi:predicted  nucleic acid-binding Zn-ribbon protein
MSDGLHPGLELRLEALAERIGVLRRAMAKATGVERLADLGEIDELDRRFRRLADRLRALNREGPGFRSDVKAEVEKITDDLSGTVEDFLMWIDAGYRGRRPTIHGDER